MTREGHRRLSRRRLLAVGGASTVGSLAGCVGGRSDDEGGGDASGAATGTTEAVSGTTSAGLGDHPAAAGLADQPRFGPPPSEAEGTVVAFEDPSCSRCAAFETGTVPKIREQLSDRVSFVLRTYPVVYPWGEPATQAIESAFARETAAREDGESTTTERDAPDTSPPGYRQGTEATWALVDHYFRTQSEFDQDNVLERTRSFLAAETELDADAVVADAESKTHDEAVQADLAAGEEADVGRTTPTVFLYRDGEFRTTATGSISFQVVKAALGV